MSHVHTQYIHMAGGSFAWVVIQSRNYNFGAFFDVSRAILAYVDTEVPTPSSAQKKIFFPEKEFRMVKQPRNDSN